MSKRKLPPNVAPKNRKADEATIYNRKTLNLYPVQGAGVAAHLSRNNLRVIASG
jgi:hypothetical protein